MFIGLFDLGNESEIIVHLRDLLHDLLEILIFYIEHRVASLEKFDVTG
jgi:hypothetical protein